MTAQKRHLRTLVSALALACTMAVASVGVAQEDTDNVITDDVEAKLTPAPESKDGWKYGLRVGASASLNHSQNVVGATDGLTLQLGLLIDSTLGFVSGNHEWQSKLKIEHAQTKTPQLDGFLKSVDNLALTTMYLYRFDFANWFGVFGRARLETSIFPAVDRRATNITVSRAAANGTVITQDIGAQEDIELTTWFEPLVITETAGAFAEPIAETYFTSTFKLGLGGQHVFAQDGYTIIDDDATPELELKQLESANSFGGEFEVDLKGAAAENVSWGVIANLFFPFVTTSESDLEGVDKLHVDISGKVSVKLAQWLSLDYTLSAKKLPFVVDLWQIQNVVLFTAGFDIL